MDKAALQRICNRLTANAVHTFFWRWFHRLPTPFTADDLQAGYAYELAFRQFEVSDTRVFDRPQTGRAFFESCRRGGRRSRTCRRQAREFYAPVARFDKLAVVSSRPPLLDDPRGKLPPDLGLVGRDREFAILTEWPKENKPGHTGDPTMFSAAVNKTAVCTPET